MHLVPDQIVDHNARKEIAGKQLRFKLARLVNTSEQMLAFAEDKNWDKVEDLEQVRREYLGSLEGINDAAAFSEEITEAYAAVLNLNAEISRLLDVEKRELLGTFQGARSRSRAAQYYKSM